MQGTVVGLSEKENRSYASELAERGFVTLAPSYPLLANYQQEPEDMGFESGTMMAIYDNSRGLDLLDSYLHKQSFLGQSSDGIIKRRNVF